MVSKTRNDSVTHSVTWDTYRTTYNWRHGDQHRHCKSSLSTAVTFAHKTRKTVRTIEIKLK